MAEVFQHTLIQCLTAVAQHHGLQISPERLISEHALGNEEPGDLAVVRIAEDVGLKAKAEHLSWDGLLAQGGVFPLIARLSNGRAVIVVGVRGDKEKKVAVLDPLASEAVVVMQDQVTFCRQWQGQVIFVKREYKLSDPKQPFGFRWFIPEILKQKDAFRDILIAAVAMHVLGMASPIFFQLVIDKVLTHQSETTLWVLGAGIVIALIFDAIFGYVRQLLTLAATNKIDMRLTRRVFSHLLTLPIDYFETATAGVITLQMQQLLSDSTFLTDQIVENQKEAVTLMTEFSSQKNLFLQNLRDAGFLSPEALESINLSSEERIRLRHKKDELSQRKTSLDTNKTNFEKELQILRQQDQPEIQLDQIIDDLKILEDTISGHHTKKGSIGQIIETDQHARSKYKKELIALEEKKKEIKPFELLNNMIGDAQGKRFNEYAQELTLKRLLQATNSNLALINARYLLDMHQEGEDMNHLYVIDQYMGNNRRAAKSTLSGGESFLVSLSMALGLSDLASGKAELGNLFIDEGFGSLDPATLESAISMLEEIQYKRGRSIGIISHVSELKDRITTQIKVIPTLGGNSKIVCG